MPGSMGVRGEGVWGNGGRVHGDMGEWGHGGRVHTSFASGT